MGGPARTYNGRRQAQSGTNRRGDILRGLQRDLSHRAIRQDLSPLRQRTHLPAQGQRVLHKGDRSDLPHLPLHKNFAPELYLGRFFIYQTSKLL